MNAKRMSRVSLLATLIATLTVFSLWARAGGQSQSESVEAHLSRARALQTKTDVDGAIEAYTAALDINPNLIAIHNHVGALLEKQDERELAFEHYMAVARLMETSGQVRRL